MIASGVASLGNISFVPAVMPESLEIIETLPNKNEKIIVERNITVEEYIRNYFSDIPIMIEIAKCESQFRHHDSNGEVLRGEENNLDRGVMQINEYFHSEDSDKLGFDILTIEGNTAYARYLFEKYGVKPWRSSSKCWGRTTAYSDYEDLAINNN